MVINNPASLPTEELTDEKIDISNYISSVFANIHVRRL
jgi:hypothetical protein